MMDEPLTYETAHRLLTKRVQLRWMREALEQARLAAIGGDYRTALAALAVAGADPLQSERLRQDIEEISLEIADPPGDRIQ